MTKIYIGCSGWYYREWSGDFYPEGLASKNYLRHYSTRFSTVEINNTFYRTPTEKAIEAWYNSTPIEFKFSIKASRYITHIKRFHDCREEIKLLYTTLDILAEKTGCFLFQLPRTMIFTSENLALIISQLNPHYKNVVEFRHPSWWNFEVIKAFENSDIGFCTVSGFNVPEDLMITGRKAYIRFHGDYTYSRSYSDKELSNWANKIKSANLEEAWIYFNNTAKGHATQNALELKQILTKQRIC